MASLRAVLDTNVLIAAFRSRHGASFEVFRRLRRGEWTAVVSNHLLFEYEEVMKRGATALGLA
jgi:predicted nucleic acid-binding protein